MPTALLAVYGLVSLVQIRLFRLRPSGARTGNLTFVLELSAKHV